ncbi:MAG: S41 family peptidase [Chitinophagales bacterium]
MNKRIIKIIAVSAVLITSFGFGADYYFAVSKNIDVFASLFTEVNMYYVDDVEPSKLMRTCVDGMLKTLDPFTNYFSESQIETARIQQGGKFGGLGIETKIMGGYPVITAVWKNQPADKMGIKVGDVIKSIDGNSTKDRKQEEIDRFLIGEPKSNVNLVLERKVSATETKSLSLTIAREEIQETNVPFYGMVTPEIGCIKLKIFNENAGKDVKDAFDSLKRANPDMKGIILDLRSNPGGLLVEAVNIVNVFVDKNELVVNTKGKVDEWNNTFKTLNEPSDLKIPVAVLTNSMSASASEIVSGTLQDYDRAVIVGQKTYGKGLVQVTKPLSYNTILKVTTAKYYIPSGRCIQALNYAERNADGSVKRIPDSLKVAFETKNGRRVWDGGGIDPDVVLAKPEHSKIAESLSEANVIFDYVTLFTLIHPTVEDPARFKLTDRDFADFVAFAKDREWKHQSESEEKLEALKEAASDEKYFDAIKPQYEAVKKKLEHSKEQDLIKQKDELIVILENEIVGRYYYAYGKVKKSYQNDPEVTRAIQVLNDPQQYNNLLAKK